MIKFYKTINLLYCMYRSETYTRTKSDTVQLQTSEMVFLTLMAGTQTSIDYTKFSKVRNLHVQ